MKILKNGKNLVGRFSCELCGCEFEENIRCCDVSSVAINNEYNAIYRCPCCGKDVGTHEIYEVEKRICKQSEDV